jgi:Replication-relaxation
MHMTTKPYTLTEVDRLVLLALNRFHYLTAAQLSRLLYPNLSDENRYAQRRLKQLSDNDYALQLRALPKPQYGQAPRVYTLARKGRTYVQGLGGAVEPYFRPSEEKRTTENSPFMTHRLATIDVMIAAQRLCRDVAGISCPRMLSERQLKRTAIHVDVVSGQGTRRVAVIPDAWFQLKVAGQHTYSIAVELDRGTEEQKVWREKIAAYAAWSVGPYQEAFETDNLTIAIVSPNMERQRQLRQWTKRELTLRELQDYSGLFLFTARDPQTTPPAAFFLARGWQLPHTDEPVELITQPPGHTESGVVFQSV